MIRLIVKLAFDDRPYTAHVDCRCGGFEATFLEGQDKFEHVCYGGSNEEGLVLIKKTQPAAATARVSTP